MFYLHFKCACRGKICPVRTKKWKFLLRISVLLFSSCMMECCDVKQRDFETLVSKKFKINSLLYPPGGGGLWVRENSLLFLKIIFDALPNQTIKIRVIQLEPLNPASCLLTEYLFGNSDWGLSRVFIKIFKITTPVGHTNLHIMNCNFMKRERVW